MGRFITYIGSPCSAMRKAQLRLKEQEEQKPIYVPKVGDILVHNSDTNEDKVVPYSEWLQLEDSWDITGLYGVTTYEEEDAENGYYVIMSNGTTLIIAPEDYEKVNDNWEQVDTIVINDPYNGHEYVDLGLPSGVKWAKMNVGANTETDYGNYYMYGNGSRTYNSSDDYYHGREDPLPLSLDTARQVMGGVWHMPTLSQLMELIMNTTHELTTIDGVNGSKFIAKNGSGNYIFIPAAGFWKDGYHPDESEGSEGYIWSSSSNSSIEAFSLSSGSYGGQSLSRERKYGFSVRGVI